MVFCCMLICPLQCAPTRTASKRSFQFNSHNTQAHTKLIPSHSFPPPFLASTSFFLYLSILFKFFFSVCQLFFFFFFFFHSCFLHVLLSLLFLHFLLRIFHFSPVVFHFVYLFSAPGGRAASKACPRYMFTSKHNQFISISSPLL